MCNEFERYAVYWVPRRPDPLAPFGTAWTGWCAERGEVRPRGRFGEVPDLPAVTAALWRHGLHGVIRAPFALAPGRSRFAVEHVLGELAEEQVSTRLPRFELGVVEGRVALVPVATSDALPALVARVAAALDRLAARGPLNGDANGFAEAPAGVHGADEGLVPFPAARAARFHMPLTDPLPTERAFALRDALAPRLAPMLGAPRRLSELALMGDPGGGRPLRVLERYALPDWPQRRGAAALPCHGPEVYSPMPAPRRRKVDIAV